MTDIFSEVTALIALVTPLLMAIAQLYKSSVSNAKLLKLTPLVVLCASIAIVYLYNTGRNA